MKYGINKQQNDVINAIQVSGSISNLEAITKYGIGGLTSRIAELRKLGIPILDKSVPIIKKSGKKAYYKAYYIEDKNIYDNVVVKGG